MAYHMEGCALCGLSRLVREAAIDPGGREDQLFWCTDTLSCSERWLRKYLSGRVMGLESVTLLGRGPTQQGVFEIAYRVGGQSEPTKRVVMPEVWSGMDQHRRSEHYHLVEFGKDVTDSFQP